MRKMNSLKLDLLNEDYEENMTQIQRMHPGTVRPPLIACDYRTSWGRRKREKGDRMKISFPSEKQTIKTFVANLCRCKGLHSKRSESHLKDVCDEVVETLSKFEIKSFDLFMSSVPKQMGRMASLPSPLRQPLIPRNVSTKQKRIIDSYDEEDVNKFYNLNTSPFHCFKLKNSSNIGQTIFVVPALQSLDSNYLGKFEISPKNKIASFSPTTSRFKTATIHPPELLQSSPVFGAPFRKTFREDEHLVSD